MSARMTGRIRPAVDAPIGKGHSCMALAGRRGRLEDARPGMSRLGRHGQADRPPGWRG